MAIDAATYDATTAQRPASARPASAPLTAMVSRDSPDSGEVGGTSDMSFWDFVDIINPLQHIPIVNTIYRHITGDTIQPASRVIGGILFGGPVGGMVSIANAVIEQAEGKDVGDQIASALGFDDGGQPAAVAVAEKPVERTITETKVMEKAAPLQGRPAEMAAAPEGAARVAGRSSAGTQVAAQLAAQQMQGGTLRDALNAPGDRPHPTRMPARDTLLANSLQARHVVPQFTAPMPGSTPAAAGAARATAAAGTAAGATGAGAAAASSLSNSAVPNPPVPNGFAPVSPDMLSETMMRNLSKYEQSRKAAQQAAPGVRLSS